MKTDTSKSTMLIISTGFLVLYIVFLWKWAIIVSLVIGLTGIISTYLSKKIEWVWMKLALVMEYIAPNIFLSIVFFVFLFPIALVSRLFSKDPLMLKKNKKSYFVDINKQMDKQAFEKIW